MPAPFPTPNLFIWNVVSASLIRSDNDDIPKTKSWRRATARTTKSHVRGAGGFYFFGSLRLVVADIVVVEHGGTSAMLAGVRPGERCTYQRQRNQDKLSSIWSRHAIPA
ncbi:hypothetical protein GWI33_016077 [Rhynchophorus ferrugineus]|uniref:Uncharacterized protein n=1 Tax=Rhynchophorus ferrugineus TaxID=354439 RepID=A0A834I1X9_RHYFE|nr:hypothetical protein GWI33_016077 [Rhynchophorus ferrugineus]